MVTLAVRGMAERNRGVPEDRHIRFRIGINLGDVIVEDRGESLESAIYQAALRLYYWMGASVAEIADLLEDAEDDLLAFYAFPTDHRTKLRSTNPLERLNREIGRRTDVVGIFPDDDSVMAVSGG